MQIEITLFDGVTGNPLKNIYITKYVNNQFVAVLNSESNEITLDVDVNTSNTYYLFSSPGYQIMTLTAAALLDTGANNWSFTLNPETSNAGNAILPIAGASLALLLLAKKKKSHNMAGIGKLEVKDVTPFLLIGGAILALGGLNKLLQALGLEKSAAGVALDNISKDPTSFWNPNYYSQFQNYNYTISTQQAVDYSSTIYHAFGPFGYDLDAITAVFHALQTKAEVSFLAKVFNDSYGKDLLSFLINGWWPEDHLSENEAVNLNAFLSNLATN